MYKNASCWKVKVIINLHSILAIKMIISREGQPQLTVEPKNDHKQVRHIHTMWKAYRKTCTGFSWSPTQRLCIHKWGRADILACMFVVTVFIWWHGIRTVHYSTIITTTTHAANQNYAEFWFQYQDKAHLTLRNDYFPIRHSTKLVIPLNTKVEMDTQIYFQSTCPCQHLLGTLLSFLARKRNISNI